MKTLHLLTTTLCDRNCINCCNKQMNLNRVKYVSDKDFKKCDTVCLTGGEPIIYSNVPMIARKIRLRYRHIKNIYVYANASELWKYINIDGVFPFLNGVSVSIKNPIDAVCFSYLIKNECINKLSSNRVYVFDNLIDEKVVPKNWKYISRIWQEKFKPAKNCIFRKI